MNSVRSTTPLSQHWALAGFALLLGAQACGGSSKAADDPSAPAAGKTELVWKDKTREQRTDWMATQVLPKMRAAFIGFDSERFADFTCQSCHGERMEMDDFKMPSDNLYALSRKDTLEKARSYDAKTTEFMLKTVLPEMATLLDTEPYDREKKAGLSCFGCHAVESD
jgi:hypothetical protein